MEYYFDRISEVVRKQIKARKLTNTDVISLRLLRAQEELGEVSRAFRDWCNDTDVVTSDALRDDLIEETVDCIISSIALFAATSAEFKEFEEIFKRKMDKWETNIDKAID